MESALWIAPLLAAFAAGGIGVFAFDHAKPRRVQSDKDNKDLQEVSESMKKELEDLRSEIDRLVNQIQAKQEKQKDLVDDYSKALKLAETARKELQASKEREAEQAVRLTALMQQIGALEARNRELTSQNSELTAAGEELDRVRANLVTSAQRNSDLQLQLTNSERALATQQSAHNTEIAEMTAKVTRGEVEANLEHEKQKAATDELVARYEELDAKFKTQSLKSMETIKLFEENSNLLKSRVSQLEGELADANSAASQAQAVPAPSPAATEEPAKAECAVPDKPLEEFTVDQIQVLLKAVGLSQYTDKLRSLEVDGDVLSMMSAEEYERRLGLTSAGALKLDRVVTALRGVVRDFPKRPASPSAQEVGPASPSPPLPDRLGTPEKSQTPQPRPPLREWVLSGALEKLKAYVESDAFDPNELDEVLEEDTKFTALHLACLARDDRIVRLLIGHGAELELVDSHKRTALHLAAFSGCLKGAGYLLECGADPNARDDKGQTPLLLAVISNQPILIDRLADGGTNLELPDENQRTAFLAAVFLGRTRCAAQLFENEANINAQDERGMSALHMLVLSKAPKKKIVKMLNLLEYFQLEVRKDVKGRTALHYAVKNNNKEMIERLVRLEKIPLGVNAVDANRRTALHYACARGYQPIALSLVRKLKAQLADPNPSRNPQIDLPDADGRTPLHLAVLHGHTACVELCLTRGADPTRCDRSGRDCLLLACLAGHLELIRLFREKIPNMTQDENGWGPLHIVCNARVTVHVAKAIEIAEFLVGHGVSPNEPDLKGRTPLFLAVTNNCSSQFLRWLTDHGADPTLLDTNGSSLLQHATLPGNTELLTYLITQHNLPTQVTDRRGCGVLHFAAHGSGNLEDVAQACHLAIDVSLVTHRGLTLLHYAVLGNNLVNVKLLVEKHGMSADISDKTKLSLLHYASFYGCFKVFRYLLERQVSPFRADDYERLPLHYAAYSGHVGIVKRLLTLGGAKMDLADRHGQTPLHFGALGGSAEVCQVLIEEGFRMEARNKNDELPAEVAGDNAEISELFDAGSDLSHSDSDFE